MVLDLAVSMVFWFAVALAIVLLADDAIAAVRKRRVRIG